MDVYELPIVMLGADTSLCSNIVWTLDAGNQGATYLWSTGAETQTVDVDTVGFGIGIQQFYVDVTNENACVNSDTINIDYKDCTGINELAKNVDVIVYPNPSDGVFNILFNSSIYIDVQLFVINNTGSVVYEKNNLSLNGKTGFNIDISNNSSGIYHFIIKSKLGIINRELIVK